MNQANRSKIVVLVFPILMHPTMGTFGDHENPAHTLVVHNHAEAAAKLKTELGLPALRKHAGKGGVSIYSETKIPSYRTVTPEDRVPAFIFYTACEEERDETLYALS